MSSATNPLAGWTGATINQPPPPSPTSTNPLTPNTNPGGLANPNSNIKDIMRNTGVTNLETGSLRNQMIPQMFDLMMKYGGSAGDFFKKLMDLGSPYYQQKQTEGFTQGVQQNQNAAAQARQQAGAAGTGFTPSGANVAMIGGMNQAGGQSLAEQFLQNLFQNENLQKGAGDSLAQLAAMFNPSAMASANVSTPGSTQGPAAAEQFSDLLKGIGSLFGSKGIPT